METYLTEPVQGKDSRRKTRNILTGVWVDVPEKLKNFRDDGLMLLTHLSGDEKRPVHWGMCLAAYPFFADTVRQIGRLIHLQNEVTMGQVRRRAVELHRDTQTIHRAVGRLVQSLCAWDILYSDHSGIYGIRQQTVITRSDLKAWLAESLLYTANSGSL